MSLYSTIYPYYQSTQDPGNLKHLEPNKSYKMWVAMIPISMHLLKPLN